MNWRTSKRIGGWRAVAVLGLTGAVLATPGRTVVAQRGSQTGLVGTWAVQVTVRDCATNVPLGAPSNSLVTFHDGGTLSESAGSLAFVPGQRSSGHGTWTRQGRRTYAQTLVALLLFDTPANLPGTPTFNPGLPVSPGFSAGWHTVTHTLTLSDANHGTAAGTNAFYKANGDEYRSGCSTAVIERF